jgi:hypothetical protein
MLMWMIQRFSPASVIEVLELVLMVMAERLVVYLGWL